MVKFFTFIGSFAIIVSTRTWQVTMRPELNESEALKEFWYLYLIAAGFLLFSLVLQETENENGRRMQD